MSERITIKVTASSPPQSISNAIVKGVQMQIEEDESINVIVRAVGAGAVNQMVKGCGIAWGLLTQSGIDIALIPGFTTAVNDQGGGALSVITMRVIWLDP